MKRNKNSKGSKGRPTASVPGRGGRRRNGSAARSRGRYNKSQWTPHRGRGRRGRGRGRGGRGRGRGGRGRGRGGRRHSQSADFEYYPFAVEKAVTVFLDKQYALLADIKDDAHAFDNKGKDCSDNVLAFLVSNTKPPYSMMWDDVLHFGSQCSRKKWLSGAGVMARVMRITAKLVRNQRNYQEFVAAFLDRFQDNDTLNVKLLDYIDKLVHAHPDVAKLTLLRPRLSVREAAQDVVTVVQALMERYDTNRRNMVMVVTRLQEATKKSKHFGNLAEQLDNLLLLDPDRDDEKGSPSARRQPDVKSQDDEEMLAKHGGSFTKFRTQSILPSLQEFAIDGSEDVALVPDNIVKGRYVNVEHYLQTHFALLKEDYVSCIREPLRLCAAHKAGLAKLRRLQRDHNFQLYPSVNIVSVCTTQLGVGLKLQIPQNMAYRLRGCKGLNYGSLVVLLVKSTYSEYMFGITVDVDADKATITCALQDAHDESEAHQDCLEQLLRAGSVAFVELKGFFFEAYQHNLRAIQEAKTEDVPLADVLIGHTHEVGDVDDLKFDVSTIFPNLDMPIDTRRDWPVLSPENESQLFAKQQQAVQRMICQQLSLVQGPPGTGKTYSTLKLLEVILGRMHQRKQQGLHSPPVLMVCYTNHALDQILLGIKELVPSAELVRAGSRSKREELSNFTLPHLRSLEKNRKLQSHSSRRAFYQTRQELEDLDYRVQRLGHNFNKVLSLERLKQLERDAPYPLFSDHVRQLEMPSNMDDSDDDDDDDEDEEEDDRKDRGRHHHANNEWQRVTRKKRSSGSKVHRWLQCQDLQYRIRYLKDMLTVLGADSKSQQPMATSNPYDALDDEDEKKSSPPSSSVSTPSAGGDQVQYLKAVLAEVQQKLTHPPRQDRLNNEELRQCQDIMSLYKPQRARLHALWQAANREMVAGQLPQLKRQYDKALRKKKELAQAFDRLICGGADILGMTTTYAARERKMLASLGIEICVVEEAAEVLEAHILTALPPTLKQLMLVGDHCQLRPSCANYTLERQKKLGISMFERLLNNGLPKVQLDIQRRMRPQIADLISSVYPELKTDPMCDDYADVKGLGRNVVFFDHDHREEHVGNIQSHSNPFEAEMVVALTEYLLKQGYGADNVTILTMYVGQLLLIRNIMRERAGSVKPWDLASVRVSSVDDFQGEENTIVILSLVRNNDNDKIGFLKTMNRANVALSRAKHGLYILGNLAGLIHDVPKRELALWPDVVNKLQDADSILEHFPLQCQTHPDAKIEASNVEHFRKAPNGGCMKLCKKRRSCGHTCRLHCHAYSCDKNKCLQVCKQSLDCGHTCKARCHRCFKDGNRQCVPCTVLVTKTMPDEVDDKPCGHEQKMKCGTPVEKHSCTAKCHVVLECGHACGRQCGQPCTVKCEKMENVRLPCGHTQAVKCWKKADLTKVECTTKCGGTGKCGHKCLSTCGQCRRAKEEHAPCKKKCGADLVCSHKCPLPCRKNCKPCMEKCNMRCSHNTCTKKCSEPCAPCREPCDWSCPHQTCTKLCFEVFFVFVYCSVGGRLLSVVLLVFNVGGWCGIQICNRERCNEPCTKKLKCGHGCFGLCGERCPPLCRVCDANKEVLDDVCMSTKVADLEPDDRLIVLEDCKHIVSARAMDRVMDAIRTQGSIGMAKCPKCKCVVRASHRYGTIIKQRRADMERVWDRILGVPALVKKLNDIQKRWATWMKLSGAHMGQEEKNLLEESSSLEREAKQALERAQEIEKVDLVQQAKKLLQSIEQGKAFTEVIHAMPEGAAHWFKCPNGHLFVIGNCGGAMQVSKCADCGAKIGGMQHRLLDGNTHAAMGGSKAPWPQ